MKKNALTLNQYSTVLNAIVQSTKISFNILCQLSSNFNAHNWYWSYLMSTVTIILNYCQVWKFLRPSLKGRVCWTMTKKNCAINSRTFLTVQHCVIYLLFLIFSSVFIRHCVSPIELNKLYHNVIINRILKALAKLS
jgi:hypothetical protein